MGSAVTRLAVDNRIKWLEKSILTLRVSHTVLLDLLPSAPDYERQMKAEYALEIKADKRMSAFVSTRKVIVSFYISS